MRVLHLFKDYYPPTHGGIEMTVSRIAEQQAAAGLAVTVLTSAAGGRRTRVEDVNGVRVVRVAEWARAFSTPICPSMPAELGRLEADVVHHHFPNPPGEVSWLLARPRGTMVVSYYADIVRQRAAMPIYGPLVRRLLASADAVLVTAPAHVESSPFLRRERERCVIVPLGIEIERFDRPEQYAVEARVLRARFGEPFILFIGVLRYYKGLHVLLDAMKRVQAHAVLVGAGPMEQSLRRQSTQLGLDKRVHFAGRVSDEELPAYVAAADIGVLPSTRVNEVFGLSQIEMMASGVPMIATELGTGTSFVNQHGESGLIVKPDDPNALADALNLLLSDSTLRARLGAGARERARRLFTVEAMMKGVDAAYRLALERHGAKRS